MIERWIAAIWLPLEQKEFLIYVLAAGLVALFMSLFSPPWWCYIPPVALLICAGMGRYLTLRQVPGKHRKST